jgi:glycosyltransferase involved in cell wall biosynthesis
MESLLYLVGSISAESIPVELAVTLHDETNADVTLVSFYDGEPPTNVPKIEQINVITLDADSRFDLRAFKRLFSVLHAEENTVLHTHDNFLGSVGRVLGSLTGVPIVNTEHTAHDSLTNIQNAVNVPTLPLSDVVAANSQTTLDSFLLLEKVLLIFTQTTVVHNGVDIEQIQQAMPVKLNKSPMIVCPARFVPVKNHKILIKSFKIFLQAYPEAILVLPGDGPLRPQIEEMVVVNDITEHVRFPGVVSRERVYQFYAGADIAVFISRSEGFCVAAVEAMAAGLPVVASDIPVLHEVLDGAARFVDHTDPAAIANELDLVLSESQLAEKLSAIGTARAAEKFPISGTIQDYVSLYKNVG